jgi:peptidoglycan/xylan/chitin deacetylase (PgdA/CDA1 family)
LKASFYVSPDRLLARREQWKDVAGSGHEIGSHTLNHPCSGNFDFSRESALEEYTLAQMEEELKRSDSLIEELINVTPLTFAYPCGQTYVGRGSGTESYVPLIAQRYLAGRIYMSETCNVPGFLDLAQLFASPFDTAPLEVMIGLIEAALDEGGWIIFCGHDVEVGGSQSIDTAKLAGVCDYLAANRARIWTDPVCAIAEYIRTNRS